VLEPWDIAPSLSPTPHGEVFALPTRRGGGLDYGLTVYLAHLITRGILPPLLKKHGLV